jgi:hypothetical protein
MDLLAELKAANGTSSLKRTKRSAILGERKSYPAEVSETNKYMTPFGERKVFRSVKPGVVSGEKKVYGVRKTLGEENRDVGGERGAARGENAEAHFKTVNSSADVHVSSNQTLKSGLSVSIQINGDSESNPSHIIINKEPPTPKPGPPTLPKEKTVHHPGVVTSKSPSQSTPQLTSQSVLKSASKPGVGASKPWIVTAQKPQGDLTMPGVPRIPGQKKVYGAASLSQKPDTMTPGTKTQKTETNQQIAAQPKVSGVNIFLCIYINLFMYLFISLFIYSFIHLFICL